jgi:hypothetical protein
MRSAHNTFILFLMFCICTIITQVFLKEMYTNSVLYGIPFCSPPPDEDAWTMPSIQSLWSAKRIRSKTFYSSMCNNLANVRTKQDVQKAYFEKYSDVPKQIPFDKYIHIITYGHYKFLEEDNAIMDQLTTLHEPSCACETRTKCRAMACNTDSWMNQVRQGLPRDMLPILYIPDQVACDYSGRSDIIFRGYNARGLAHEFIHNWGYWTHSIAVCKAFVNVGIVTVCQKKNCCDNAIFGHNNVGDLTCIMGYGPSSFLNVAVAKEVLRIVVPIRELVRGAQTQNVTITIPALEFTNKNCVIVSHPSVRSQRYYISYHRQNTPVWHDGNFDLPNYAAGTVCVHLWKGGNSILMNVFKTNKHVITDSTIGAQANALDGFTVECVRTLPNRAIVEVTY